MARAKQSEAERIRARRAAEFGEIVKDAPERVAWVYPSPYNAGMSSLGFQTLYRTINGTEGRAAHRAFLPDEPAETSQLLTYEAGVPVGDYPILALSVAYEIELAGVIQTLELAGARCAGVGAFGARSARALRRTADLQQPAAARPLRRRHLDG